MDGVAEIDGAVGVIQCPMKECKQQLGVWANEIKCTCDRVVKTAYVIYKSKVH